MILSLSNFVWANRIIPQPPFLELPVPAIAVDLASREGVAVWTTLSPGDATTGGGMVYQEYSWPLPKGMKTVFGEVDRLTSSSAELWTPGVARSFPDQLVVSDAFDPGLFVDAAGSSRVVWAAPEGTFQSAPLPLTTIQALTGTEELLFAYGTLKMDRILMVGRRADLQSGGNWIIPGPFADQRTNPTLVVLDEDFLAVVGGTVTGGEGGQLPASQVMLTRYNAEPSLSLYKPHPLPVSFGENHRVVKCNDVVMILDEFAEDSTMTRAQFARYQGSGSFTPWATGHYGFNLDEIGEIATDESLHVMLVETNSKETGERVLQLYHLPNSALKQRKAAEEARAKLRVVEYLYFQTALNRALKEEKSVLVLNPNLDTETRGKLEALINTYNGKLMLEESFLAQPRPEEITAYTEKLTPLLGGAPDAKLFVLLNSNGELLNSTEQPLATPEELFVFLKPLWEP
ncbi:MAG: hypothetical protein SFY68_08205 [Candidatus Sumerlaeia bacterium]|nr:hypothetical protein [Candidatus Sumerlaeia bacterium]